MVASTGFPGSDEKNLKTLEFKIMYLLPKYADFRSNARNKIKRRKKENENDNDNSKKKNQRASKNSSSSRTARNK